MDITKIDTNFKTENVIIDGDKKIYKLPCADIDLYGGFYDEEKGWFQRMPYDIAKQVSLGVEVLSSTTSGLRARFSSNSKKLILNVKYKYIAKMSNMPISASSGFILLEEKQNCYYHIASLRPTIDDAQGYTQSVDLSGEMKDYILFFPMYNDYVTEVSLAFDGTAIVKPGRKYKFELPIVYYGSSITQGGCVSRADNSYQALISKWNNLDYINLGFSGNAKGEEIMAEYLAKIKAKIFVCDYDHNAPTPEHLENTHYKLYKKYRTNNPNTPILLVTRPDFDTTPENSLKRWKIVKGTYNKAVKEGDKNIYFVDGRKFFGVKDRENCTVDTCHPNDLGHYRMAEKINKFISKLV